MDSVPDKKSAKKEEYRGRLTGKARVEHEKLLKRIDNMSDAEYKAYRKKWHEPSAEQMKKYHAQRRKEKKKRRKKRKD